MKDVRDNPFSFLDDWYGRLEDIIEDFKEHGFDVLNATAEFIDIADKDDKEYVVKLGGTARTITINKIECLNESTSLMEGGIYPVALIGGADDAFLKVINEILGGDINEVDNLELIPALGFGGAGRYWYKANITIDEDTIVNYITEESTPETYRLMKNETLIINPYSDIDITCSADNDSYHDGIDLDALSNSDADMKKLNKESNIIGSAIIAKLFEAEDKIIKILKKYEDIDDEELDESLIPIQEEFDEYSDDELASIYGGDTTKSQKDIARDELLASKNALRIYINSSINAGGFQIAIINSNNNVIFDKQYHYGYTVSYDKSFANEEKPYVTDLIANLCKKYNVPKENIFVLTGKNRFTGKEIDNTAAIEFENKYLKDLMLEAFDNWIEPKLGKKIKQLKGWKIYQGTDSSGDEVFRCFTPDEDRPEVGYEDWECETLEQAISWIENYDLEESKNVNNDSNKEDLSNVSEGDLSDSDDGYIVIEKDTFGNYEENVFTALDNIEMLVSSYEEVNSDTLKNLISMLEDELDTLKKINMKLITGITQYTL